MGYVAENPCTYSERYMTNKLKETQENQYVQKWQVKSATESKFSVIHKLKKHKYTYSLYLDLIECIEDRRLLTNLRLGCSKLKGHRYLKTTEDLICGLCNLSTEDAPHLLISCTHENIVKIRNDHYNKIESVYPSFKNLNDGSKLLSILNLCMFDDHFNPDFIPKCVNFVKDIMKARLE